MWPAMQLVHRHLYFLGYHEEPIELAEEVEYRIISSRVVRRSDHIEMRHLVQEIKK